MRQTVILPFHSHQDICCAHPQPNLSFTDSLWLSAVRLGCSWRLAHSSWNVFLIRIIKRFEHLEISSPRQWRWSLCSEFRSGPPRVPPQPRLGSSPLLPSKAPGHLFLVFHWSSRMQRPTRFRKFSCVVQAFQPDLLYLILFSTLKRNLKHDPPKSAITFGKHV